MDGIWPSVTHQFSYDKIYQPVYTYLVRIYTIVFSAVCVQGSNQLAAIDCSQSTEQTASDTLRREVHDEDTHQWLGSFALPPCQSASVHLFSLSLFQYFPFLHNKALSAYNNKHYWRRNRPTDQHKSNRGGEL